MDTCTQLEPIQPPKKKTSQQSALDDSWSVLDDSDYIESINFGILGEPTTPYLLDPEHGTQLNIQLLSNNLVYPGQFDRAGYDIVYVFEPVLRDPANKLSFTYLFDAVLGYFYDLSEHILNRDYVKDVLVVCVLGEDVPPPRVANLLVEFIAPYKGHNLKLLIVLDKNFESKKFKQLKSSIETEKVFTKVEHCRRGALFDRIDRDAIPGELGGEFESTTMDIWLNKRLKFEVFWEDCRNSYKRLQYLPQSLKRVFKEVISEHKGKSLETLKEKYREGNTEYTFTQNFQLHSKSLLEDLSPEETTNDKMIGDAIRTLARVMSELEEQYLEYQSVLEGTLDAHWRWQEFKKETDHMTTVAEELRSRIRELSETDSETEALNEAYSVLQSAKTTVHELCKRKEGLPTKKRTKAESKLVHLENIIAENFSELGKNNEKMINTEFVLNIQFNILSWIKEFEDLLHIASDAAHDDPFRTVLEKDAKIRKKLRYCPIEVIEDFFETCQKIGTDFLLGSMLGVETCIARLIEKIAETSQQISSTIKDKAGTMTGRLAALLSRLTALDNGTETMVECTTSFEKMLSLMHTFKETGAIEYPEIADLEFLAECKAAPLVSQVEVLDELVQTIAKCVQGESEELQLSLFHRSRSNSSRNIKDVKSPYSGTASRYTRRDSLRKLLTTTKTTDDHLDELEELVKNLERHHMRRLIEGIATTQAKKSEKSTQKLHHILKEFKDTENAYIKSIEYLHDELIQKATADEDFSLDRDVTECLRAARDLLQHIIQLNKKFDSQVRGSNGGALKFARVFTSLVREFNMYTEFIKLQSRLEQILLQDYFKDIQTLNSDPLTAESYVNKPMQRLCKYKLLFEDTLLNTSNVFEVPSVNLAVVQSSKLLRTINGILHLEEETFRLQETSLFYLYARVSLLDTSNSDRKAYLFKDNLYLSKPSKEYVSFELKSVVLLAVEKARLEMALRVVQQPAVLAASTLKRGTTLRKSKGQCTSSQATRVITLVFHEYTDLVEWTFKLKNVLGKYY